MLLKMATEGLCAKEDIVPEVERIRGVPCWLFLEEKGNAELVKKVRVGVQRLRESGTEVRYTEYSDNGGQLGSQVFATPDLYTWFAGRRKAVQRR